jgi:subtilisin family serine protease
MSATRRLFNLAKLSIATAAIWPTSAYSLQTVMLADREGGHAFSVADGELVVKLAPGISPATAARMAARYHIQVRRQLDRGSYLVTLPPEAELAAAIREAGQAYDPRAGRIRNAARVLAADPSIDLAEPNGIMRSQGGEWVPNDHYYEDQWHFHQLGMEKAWGFQGLGCSDVKVAILDTGVKWSHRSWNFETKMVDPWDFVDNDEIPDDMNGHGTHTAGIIGVSTDNFLGLAGMAPDLSIMPLRVLDADGVGTLDRLIAALDWAIQHDADVVNMSLSFPPGFYPGEILEAKIIEAKNASVVMIASSGNDGVGVLPFPAAFNDVIAVGAVDKAGNPAGYANWGPGLDVVTYGGMPEDSDDDGTVDGILSISFDREDPYREIGYWFAAGTSQAAPQVAALAGLLRCINDYSPKRVRRLIFAGAQLPEEILQSDAISCVTANSKRLSDGTNEDRTFCWHPNYGFGIIDPYETLSQLVVLGKGVEKKVGSRIADYQALPPFFPEGLFGFIVDTPEGLLLLMEDETGLYAFIDSGCDSRTFEAELESGGSYQSDCDIAQYLLSDWTLEELVTVEGGLIEFIHNNGGLLGFIGNNGALLGTMSNNGGLLGMITHNGGLLGMLAGNGGMLALIDANGGVLEMMAGNGGLLGFLSGNGGLLELMSNNGGLIGLMSNNGGLLGYIGSNGSVIGLMNVEGQSVSGVDRIELSHWFRFW